MHPVNLEELPLPVLGAMAQALMDIDPPLNLPAAREIAEALKAGNRDEIIRLLPAAMAEVREARWLAEKGIFPL